MNLESLALFATGAVVGAVLTYVLGLRKSRRQRLHSHYEDMYPLITDSILLIELTKNIENLDLASEETFFSKYALISTGLSTIADKEIYLSETGRVQQAHSKSRSKKTEVQILEESRIRVVSILMLEVMDNLRALKRHQEVLEFSKPSQNVVTGLEEAYNAISGGYSEISLWVVRLIESEDESKLWKEIGEFYESQVKHSESVMSALLRLKTAMKKDMHRWF